MLKRERRGKRKRKREKELRKEFKLKKAGLARSIRIFLKFKSNLLFVKKLYLIKFWNGAPLIEKMMPKKRKINQNHQNPRVYMKKKLKD